MGFNPASLANVLEMNFENVSAVVITGLVVVFIGLILLILFVSGIGVLFTKKAERKKKKEVRTETVQTKKPAPLPTAPIVEDGICDEVVAVITAAVAAMSSDGSKKLVLKSVKTAKPQRNAWAAAGLMDNTRPFF